MRRKAFVIIKDGDLLKGIDLERCGNMHMMLSVVVCTYNRALLLIKCLQSLTEQTLDKGKYEVIIIDNNSHDNTQEVIENFVARYDNFFSYIEYNQGLSHARNRGYKEAKGEFVAYIDDDAMADSEWTERIIKDFNTIKPTPNVIGGKIIPYYDTPKPGWFLDEFETHTWGEAACFLEEDKAKNGFSGSNMAFLRDDLEKYKGFSVNLGMNGETISTGEETELFHRMYEKKMILWYNPRILVKHFCPEKNMCAWYRFKRCYVNAFSWLEINGDGDGNIYINIKKVFYYNYMILCGIFELVKNVLCEFKIKKNIFIFASKLGGYIAGIVYLIKAIFK